MSTAPCAPHARVLATLLVGDVQRPEFAAARGDLAAMGPLVEAATVAQAAARIENERFVPQVIVLAEVYPGQLGQAEVDRLRSLAPLARMIGLLGSWCEGETRTGKPWPGVIRVYWYDWGSCRRELDRLRRGESRFLSLPATATEEERLLARRASLDERGGTAGLSSSVGPTGGQATRATPGSQTDRGALIVVCSARRAMSDWLAEACRHRGYQTLQWEPGGKGPTWGAAAAIVDVDPLSADPFGPLRTLAEALQPAPVIALLEFPRLDECEAARRQGAKALLPSPLLLDDLYRDLDAVMAAAMAAI